MTTSASMATSEAPARRGLTRLLRDDWLVEMAWVIASSVDFNIRGEPIVSPLCAANAAGVVLKALDDLNGPYSVGAVKEMVAVKRNQLARDSRARPNEVAGYNVYDCARPTRALLM